MTKRETLHETMVNELERLSVCEDSEVDKIMEKIESTLDKIEETIEKED